MKFPIEWANCLKYECLALNKIQNDDYQLELQHKLHDLLLSWAKTGDQQHPLVANIAASAHRHCQQNLQQAMVKSVQQATFWDVVKYQNVYTN